MTYVVIAVVLLFALCFVWAKGYSYGKRTMLDLMRGHYRIGRGFMASLNYEYDVLNGRIPKS